jgi:hypothetical protein
MADNNGIFYTTATILPNKSIIYLIYYASEFYWARQMRTVSS